ncbi:hypothetical protein B5807_08097 [Epicoccum nigrum]|jgi:hypothetical protein|uniref:Uncharacterized protein n=1 Tax=Epicoccum nigrum TaxID=105696 RepID=A0A1Y2LRR4_EPING|nr:hypothetical protein B5807_08097 [Epicoccum nigrum]
MASASSDDIKELPVIWLLSPPGLQPSKHSFPVRAAAIVASATAIFLIILAFTPRFCKKRKASKAAKEAAKENVRHFELKGSIRVVHPPSPLPFPYRVDNSPEMFSAFQAQDYRKDSAHKSIQANAIATVPSSPRSYNIPSYYKTAEALDDHANGFATRALSFHPWQTPSSSTYSHSELYPAPLVISRSRGRDKVPGKAYEKDETFI